jgi:hypothetical protein
MADRLDGIMAELAEVKRGAVFPSCEKDDADKRWLAAEVLRLWADLHEAMTQHGVTLQNAVQLRADLAAMTLKRDVLFEDATAQIRQLKAENAQVQALLESGMDENAALAEAVDDLTKQTDRAEADLAARADNDAWWREQRDIWQTLLAEADAKVAARDARWAQVVALAAEHAGCIDDEAKGEFTVTGIVGNYHRAAIRMRFMEKVRALASPVPKEGA